MKTSKSDNSKSKADRQKRTSYLKSALNMNLLKGFENMNVLEIYIHQNFPKKLKFDLVINNKL